MYTPGDKSQFIAFAIKSGKHKPDAADKEILDWINDQFDVRALHFFHETRAQQQLIHLILDTLADVKKLQSNQASKAIAEKFPFPEVIVTYRPLKELSQEILTEMRNDDERAILKTFESVWTMSENVVFYFTDKQLTENQANGTSDNIREQLNKVDDRYGVSQAFRFDSKEAFDRDYESNWYYYWK